MNKINFFKDSVYLDIASKLALLSKDENTKVASIIVASDGSPVSWGYNGTIPGFPDDEVPHSRDFKELSYCENGETKIFKQNKYPFMEHAEANAIDFGDKEKMKDATIYVSHLPCQACARKIAKHKISRVVVANTPNNTESTVGADSDITKYIFSLAKIDLWVAGNQITLIEPRT